MATITNNRPITYPHRLIESKWDGKTSNGTPYKAGDKVIYCCHAKRVISVYRPPCNDTKAA
jgi:hypothetical protein